jgi:hypothetical protein
MLTYSQFRLLSVQAALFTPDTNQFSQTHVLSSVLAKYAPRFNGPVQALPFPPDVPSDVPQLILRSTDGAFRFQAGPARIDSFRTRTDTKAADHDLARECVEVLDHYIQAAQPPVRVGRLALIITRLTIDEALAQSLIERFCNDESRRLPFRNSQHFELHNHKTYELNPLGLRVNSWVRCKAVTVVQPQRSRKVLVEQDINTLEEELSQNSFGADETRRFYDSAIGEADSILRLYFPEGD